VKKFALHSKLKEIAKKQSAITALDVWLSVLKTQLNLKKRKANKIFYFKTHISVFFELKHEHIHDFIEYVNIQGEGFFL
jgi:hypothetical protein